jgi:hypothetical protein
MGGFIEYTVQSIQTKETVSEIEKSKLDTKFKTSATTIVAVDVEAAVNLQKECDTRNAETGFESRANIIVVGGSQGMGIMMNEKAGDSIDKWTDSFKATSGADNNCSILTDSNLKLVGIWELLPNTPQYNARKREIMNEYIRLSIEQDFDFFSKFIYKGSRAMPQYVKVNEYMSGSPDLEGKIPINNKYEFQSIGTGGTYPLNGNYVLTSDINLSGVTTFGLDEKTFTGTFDGNGHTIYNYGNTGDGLPQYFPRDTGAAQQYFGLFSRNTGTIKNLSIKNSKLAVNVGISAGNSVDVGMICGRNDGTIENCRVIDSTISLNGWGVFYNETAPIFTCGGITGRNTRTISKCSFTNSQDKSIFVNMYTNSMKIPQSSSSVHDNIFVYTGGIAGWATNGQTYKIIDCFTNVKISSNVTVGNNSGYAWLTYRPRIPQASGGIAGVASGRIERCFALGTNSTNCDVVYYADSSGQYTCPTSPEISNQNGKLAGFADPDLGYNIFLDCYHLSGTGAVGGGKSAGAITVASFKEYSMTSKLVANGWTYTDQNPYPLLPTVTLPNFAVYYKNGRPDYTAGFAFDYNLSNNMTVYFSGLRNITSDVELLYDFSEPGQQVVQFSYRDSNNTLYIGELPVTVKPFPDMTIPDPPVYVCEIGSTGYAGLPAAVAAAQNGQTIKLLKDIALNQGISVSGKNITLDLNGFNLNVTAVSTGLEVNNGAFDLTGMGEFNITVVHPYYSCVRVSDGRATVTEVKRTGGDNIAPIPAVYAQGAASLVTVRRNIISQEGGIFAYSGAKAVVGGSIFCSGFGVYTSIDSCEITVGGSVIVNTNGFEAVAVDGPRHKVTIKGDIVVLPGAPYITFVTEGFGYTYFNEKDYSRPRKLIDGAYYLQYDTSHLAGLAPANVSYIWVMDDRPEDPACSIGSSQLFADLPAALKAVQNNQTIKLLKDITLSQAIDVQNKNITFDLNGYNLAVNAPGIGFYVYNGAVDLAGAGEFNVNGAVSVNNGRATVTEVNLFDASPSTTAVSVFGSASSVTVRRNIFSQAAGVAISNGAKASVGGSIFVTSGYGIQASGSSCEITVEGNVTASQAVGSSGVALYGAGHKAIIKGEISVLNTSYITLGTVGNTYTYISGKDYSRPRKLIDGVYYLEYDNSQVMGLAPADVNTVWVKDDRTESDFICAIGSDMYSDLQNAINAALNNQTIRLLDNITANKQITVSGKNITIDLDGRLLVVNGPTTEPALKVSNGAVDLTGAGSFEVYGNSWYAYSVEVINGRAAMTEVGVLADLGTAVHVSGAGSLVTVSGNVTAQGYGIYAENGGSAAVSGDIFTNTGAGVVIDAGIGSEVTVEGSIVVKTAGYNGVRTRGARHKVTVKGGIFTTGVGYIYFSGDSGNLSYPEKDYSRNIKIIDGERYLEYENSGLAGVQPADISYVWVKDDGEGGTLIGNNGSLFYTFESALATCWNGTAYNGAIGLTNNFTYNASLADKPIWNGNLDFNLNGKTLSILSPFGLELSGGIFSLKNVNGGALNLQGGLMVSGAHATVNNIAPYNYSGGVYANNMSEVDILGNVSGSSGVKALNSSVVRVGGNTTGNDAGVNNCGYGAAASSGSTVTVSGNAAGDIGVYAISSGSTVQINGNVTASFNVVKSASLQPIGAYAVSGGTIIIDGVITLPQGGVYVQVGTKIMEKSEGVQSTVKKGYLVYTDDDSYVYIKDDGSVVIPEGKAQMPIATPGSGEVETDTLVTLIAPEPGAGIYYTTDGTTPVIKKPGPNYMGPIPITKNMTIKAIAVVTGKNPSDVAQFEYKVKEPVEPMLPAPTASVPSGMVTAGTYVALSTIRIGKITPQIYFTTDGSNPIEDGVLYYEPIPIKDDVVVIKAVAILGKVVSEEAVFTYILKTSSNAILTVSKTSGRFGDEVEVNVSIANNPGIAGFTLNMDYDATKLQYLSVAKSAQLPGSLDALKSADGRVRVNWTNATNFTGSGVLYTVHFKIIDQEYFGDTPVTLCLSGDDVITNQTFQEITAIFSSGSVTLVSPVYILPGDINQDGKVNAIDAVMLAQYLAGGFGIQLSPTGLIAADMNSDGKINAIDAVMLAQRILNGSMPAASPSAPPDPGQDGILSDYQEPAAEYSDDPAVYPVPLSVNDGSTLTVGVPGNILQPGDEFDVTVSITNSTGIAALFSELKYDPTQFEYISTTRAGSTFTQGNFNSSDGANEDEMYQRVRTVIFHSSDFINGSGLIYTVRFRVNDHAQGGNYPFELLYEPDNDIANQLWNYINPGVLNGSVKVAEESAGMSVSGTVLYQTSFTSATVSLYNSTDELNPIVTTETGENGSYTLTVPIAPVGTLYKLVVTKPGYLSYTIKNLTLTEGEDIPTIDMRSLAGDVNGDGIVNAVDLTCLLSEFNREPVAFKEADIDGNGIVNAADLTYLLAGFNKRNVEEIWN